MRKLTLTAAAGLLALAGLVVATPAQAAADDCKSVTVDLPARPDSGTKGNNWATNKMTRVLTVCATKTPTEGDWTYKATVSDTGTFTTAAGDSPGGTATLKGGTKGTIKGGFTATFTAPKWSGSLTTPAATTPTGEWVATAFPGAKFDQAGAVAKWAWTYTTACESWTNAEAGNSGDITEKVCPSPTPTKSPTGAPSTPAAPPTVPGASGGLPVTGDSLPLIAGGGALLLALGAGALWLTRRRRFTA